MSPRAWIPWFVLTVALLATATGTLYVHQMNQNREQARFLAAVRETKSKIAGRIETYVNLLRSGSGLFAASGEVTQDEFHTYAERLALSDRYPGIQGIGFTRCVSPDEKDAVVASLRQQGITTTGPASQNSGPAATQPFHIWPDPPPRDEYHAIIYLEPLDRRNHAAIGYDMSTEPTRAEAMALARDTGLAAATGKVRLVQEIDENVQAGFLIYVPVYRGGVVPPTVQERREKLLGFVYSPFRVDDLLKGIFADDEEHAVDFAIYDGTTVSEDSLLHRSRAEMVENIADQRRTTTLVMQPEDRTWQGRPWTVVFTAQPDFELASGSTLEWTVPIAGLLLSGVLFFLTRTQAQALVERERAAEERLKLLSREQEARQEAERANRLKDEFLATVSHELRTPLNAILGWAQLLRSDKMDPELIEQGLEAIERNSKIQSQLIEDLLDVSRIISGRLRLSIEPVDAIAPIEAAIETVRPAAQAKEIGLIQHLDPSAGLVMGDPTRLQQVAWNLLSNAIKFTSRGNRVEVRLQRVGNLYIELAVQDSGQGISAEFLPYVFERFRQADGSTTRRHGGLGLGLAITRHLVELHGGTIHAYSDGLGKGTTFTVRLPVQAADGSVPVPDASMAVVQTDVCGETQTKRLDGIRVLVVDDEPDARELMRTILSQAHARVTTVASAREALASLAETVPHVLISDISMPEEDGYALIRQVRALPPDGGGQIPAIALTAFARTEDHRRALEAGFQVHIAKPVEAAHITALIARFAKRPQPNRVPAASREAR